MSGRTYRVACVTGSGTGPELMAEASRALDAVAPLHGFGIEQVHVSFGADAVARIGHALPLATRTAYLQADAVLVAGEDEPALAVVQSELDLRARLTRVCFGSRGDVVLLAPLAEEAAEWTIRRAFELARARRLHVTAVADGGRWHELVAAEEARQEGLLVEHLQAAEAMPAVAFEAERFDVLVAGPQLAESLASLIGVAVVPARVAATGLLSEHGPGLYVPLGSASSTLAGQGVANPSSMLLATSLLLAEGLGERGAADTLSGALAEALGSSGRTIDRGRRGVAATTREFTDAVLEGFQLAFTNAEFHPGAWTR